MSLDPVESACCSTMIALLESQKKLAQLHKEIGQGLVAVMLELAALRDTVRANDPEFSVTHKQNLQKRVEEGVRTTPLIGELPQMIEDLSGRYDEMIYALRQLQTQR